eukprot:CAMPEP_0201512104 /NCGR_PEP_ID=MMETSP0161_2-20130828/4435_1 /ASSEMBLY_ACC=CAM_ASM_000251 /TAXON_ID=180227 /ORGANISM="Neoparamoeba aestuarina, Strain SoJaBio B1-5/56/2" /LENGTH=236 /DNA_ID=CAMNT_0047907831 /DNA_START=114 /DNA_END=824 /DNA_ORIENTATION=+
MGQYQAVNPLLLVKMDMESTWSVYKRFFVNNAAYLDGKTGSGDEVLENIIGAELEFDRQKKRKKENENKDGKKGDGGEGKEGKKEGNYDLPPILDIPPIKNMFCLYGVNRATEVGYYYKQNKSGKYFLDSSADESSKKSDAINPNKLTIRGGIAYETRTTVQPASAGVMISGDGTVPYQSLAYPLQWEKMAKERGIDFNLEITEIQGSEHRKMLQEESVLLNVLSYCCYGKRAADL